MTDIQVRYWQNIETQRHNEAMEKQAFRDSQIKYIDVLESRRHNLVGEQINLLGLKETSRHNRATEANDYIKASASYRQSTAALENARANIRNAATNERLASVQEGRLSIDKKVANSTMALNYAKAARERQSTATEKHKTTTASQEAKYAGANQVAGLVQTYSTVAKNLVTMATEAAGKIVSFALPVANAFK